MNEQVGYAIVSIAVLALSGCGKSESKPESGKGAPASAGEASDPKPAEPATPAPEAAVGLAPVTLANAAADGEKEAAEELAAKLVDPAQQGAEVANQANARLFLLLAATSSDPEVVAVALDGISRSFGSGKAAVDGDVVAVIAARLGATDHAVLAPAVLAARDVVLREEAVFEPVAAALAALIGRADDPSAQYAALDYTTDAYRKQSPAIVAATLAALDSEADHVAAKALVSLGFFAGKEMPSAEAFEAKVEALLAHSNPAVRGEACEILARFAPWGDEAAAKVLAGKFLPLLEDEEPFVKSQAASALAAIKYKPGIHAMMKHLDDNRKNTFSIEGWTTIWGKSGWDHHDGSAWSRVDEAMLAAIARTTYFDQGKSKFEFDVDTKTVDEDIARAITKVKAWYEANKAELPPLE